MTTQAQTHETILAADPEGVGPASRLLDFFNPDSISQAFEEEGWDAAAMISQLAGIATDAANNTARERMSAMKMLQDQGKEALNLHGFIRRFTAQLEEEKGGVKKRITADGIELLKAGAARTMSTLDLLEAGSQTHEMIDVEPKETPNDTTTGGNVRVTARQLSSPNPDSGGGGNGRPPPVGGSGHSLTRPCSELRLDEEQRSGTPGPQIEEQTKRNDQGTVQGADDERGSRLSQQPGRGHQNQNPGDPSLQHQHQHRELGEGDVPSSGRSQPRTTPYTPGESRRRANRRACSPSPQEFRPTTTGGGNTRPPDGATDRPHIRATVLDPATAGDSDEWPGNTGPWADE